MKAKINELAARFIECGSCGYERSFLFPESLHFGSFEWYCSNCNQLWKVLLSKQGELSLEKRHATVNHSTILIHLTEPVTPVMILAYKNKFSGEEVNRQKVEGNSSETQIFHLFVTEQNNEINPHGFSEYMATL